MNGETMNDRIEAIKRNQELYKALLLAKENLPVVGKDRTVVVQKNGGGSYKYSYADLADIDRKATPVLTERGLMIDFEMHKAEDGTPVLTGMLIHPESGGFKTSEWDVTGRTPQDQGSSITYGRRYLTGILTGIITDDDTDGQQTQPGAPAAPRQREPKPADPATTEQIEQLTAAGQAGIDLGPIMQSTIGRVAGQRTITREEAAKVLEACSVHQS